MFQEGWGGVDMQQAKPSIWPWLAPFIPSQGQAGYKARQRGPIKTLQSEKCGVSQPQLSGSAHSQQRHFFQLFSAKPFSAMEVKSSFGKHCLAVNFL